MDPQVPRQGSHKGNTGAATQAVRISKPVEAVPDDPSGERKNSARHGSNLLLHHNYDPLPGSITDLLHPTGPNDGYKHHRLVQDPARLTRHHPCLLPHHHSPHLRPGDRPVRQEIHWPPDRHNPPAENRCRTSSIVALNGCGCDHGGEAEKGGPRPRHARCDTCRSAAAHQRVLALLPVLRLWDRRHVHVRRAPRAVLL